MNGTADSGPEANKNPLSGMLQERNKVIIDAARQLGYLSRYLRSSADIDKETALDLVGDVYKALGYDPSESRIPNIRELYQRCGDVPQQQQEKERGSDPATGG